MRYSSAAPLLYGFCAAFICRPAMASADDGCLVWRHAPVGMELTVEPTPAPGTSCIRTSFRRFSQSEALKLMADRKVLILGDSVASYWYVSLAYFLHSGDTLKTWDTKARGHAHPLFEQWWSQIGSHWSSARWWAWNHYYNTTNTNLGGHEICDCWRDSCFSKCRPQSYFGNRHFRFGGGSNQGRLDLIPSFGDAIRPRWHTLDTESWRLRCKVPMEGTDSRRCAEGSPAARDLANVSDVATELDAVVEEFKVARSD
jgi:hypothetical protein